MGFIKLLFGLFRCFHVLLQYYFAGNEYFFVIFLFVITQA